MKRMLISAAALFLFAVGGSHLAAQQIDVLRYRAVITFEPTARTIDGRAELDIRNASRSPMRTVALDLRDLTVRQVRQGGNALTFAHEDNILTVTLAAPVESNDSVTVEVEYGGTPTSESGSPSWGGCFWGDPSFAMGVGFTAPYVSMTRHWLPSHDEPDDKAAFDLTYIVPQGYSAAGTGVLAGVRDEGAGTAWRWVETHPTATYLVTWAVGHYALVESSWNGIPMMFFVPKADSAKAVTWFQPLTGMLDAYSRMFGPYPFDKVGYCLTPIGSMEHQTMVSLAQSVFDGATKAEMTVAHELAHQWWGDCVTARDFRHAWLSEGFAQYSETVYLEKSISRASYLSQTRANNTIYKNTVEPYEGTFALYDFPRAAPSSNYPMTIYYKGSSVLAMLRMVMGDSAFFDGLRRYRAAHEYGAATTADFQAAMEEASSINLPWFFDEWVYKPGYPNYQIQRVKDPAGPLRVRILQIQDTSRIPLFRMPLPIQVVTTKGDTIRDVLLTSAATWQEFTLPVDEADVKSITIDPDGIVLKKISYSTVKSEPLSEPQGFLLQQNHPNPFSRGTGTVIPFSVETASHVTVDVVDLLGRSRGTVTDGWYAPGEFSVTFQPGAMPSGTYLIRMRAGGRLASRVMMLE